MIKRDLQSKPGFRQRQFAPYVLAKHYEPATILYTDES
jgi:hypothetical protein